MRSHDTGSLELRGQPLSLDEVHDVAVSLRGVRLTSDEAVRQRVRAAEELVQGAVQRQSRIYGVTTGFGSMSDVTVPAEMAAALQTNLLNFLATGAGAEVARQHVRAAMVLRANMLLRGVSGVRWEIVRRLVTFLDQDAVPVVGELGSIGASGDLVPLATIARAITGQGGGCQVSLQGRQLAAGEVLAELGLPALPLMPKEGLAMVNGTSFSAAIAANCVHAARDLLAVTLACNAMMTRALLGHHDPFHPFVHQCKPHAGQLWVAATLRDLLADDPAADPTAADPTAADPTEGFARPHLQDAYSLRCMPQYLGPLVEGIARVAHTVHTEMNSVSDNPLIDADTGEFHQSGNFLGQYIGVAMDDLRRDLGLLAKHLDVQIALLVAPEFNHGLPASLTGNAELPLNMGLKGLQITGNSIMPLLTYYGNPLVGHFPTHAEQFNQNVNGLSWGAAHLAWQSVELFRHYAAVALLFAVQAVDLRARAALGHYDGLALLGDSVRPLYEAVYETVGRVPGSSSPLVFNDADQRLADFQAALFSTLSENGRISEAVRSVRESFDASFSTVDPVP